jgi:hypothetical protein
VVVPVKYRTIVADPPWEITMRMRAQPDDVEE